MALKIGVLGSGSGDVLQNIINAIENGLINAEIACVISDVEDAKLLEVAKNHEIDSLFIEYIGGKEILFDKAVAKEFDTRKVDLVILLGFMKTLSSWFCDHYANRIIDAYPSLLPLFIEKKGVNIYEEVLNLGLKVTGCTIHFVTSEYGKGPIIMQVPIAVEDDDNHETLKNKVHKAETEALIETIRLFSENKLKIEGRKVRILK
ncbi:MAG: phosphoribosylglycinamide formyltransferase [Candidatus Aenigmatarchaeota archaeon]